MCTVSRLSIISQHIIVDNIENFIVLIKKNTRCHRELTNTIMIEGRGLEKQNHSPLKSANKGYPWNLFSTMSANKGYPWNLFLRMSHQEIVSMEKLK